MQPSVVASTHPNRPAFRNQNAASTLHTTASLCTCRTCAHVCVCCMPVYVLSPVHLAHTISTCVSGCVIFQLEYTFSLVCESCSEQEQRALFRHTARGIHHHHKSHTFRESQTPQAVDVNEAACNASERSASKNTECALMF